MQASTQITEGVGQFRNGGRRARTATAANQPVVRESTTPIRHGEARFLTSTTVRIYAPFSAVLRAPTARCVVSCSPLAELRCALSLPIWAIRHRPRVWCTPVPRCSGRGSTTPMGRNDRQPQTLPEQDLDWRISWELQYEMKVSKRKKRSESTRRGPSWQNRPQAPSKMQFPWPFGVPRIRDRE